MDLRWLFLALLGCASAGSPSMFGKITSPNYPQSYPSNANETWEIQVPQGYGIRLYFLQLNIEPSENCEKSSLKVIIGDKVQQTLCHGRSVGSAGIPKDKKYYPTTHLKLVFTSDASNHDRFTGFSAYYTAVDVDECEDVQPHPCAHACHNYIGGYFCSCPQESEQHTCEALSCENPPAIRNGHYTILAKPTKEMLQASVIYNCTEPFYTMVTRTGSAKFTCSEDRVWRDEHGGHEIPQCVPVCGRPLISLVEHSRIIKGNKAAPGNFPWQVLVRKNGHGGGALIGERWVMTAAHIVRQQNSEAGEDEDATDLHLFVGDIDSDSLIEKGTLLVKGVHVHPNYTTSNHDNDIALIELQDLVTMDENVSPICLPENSDEVLYESGLVGYVSGFGITERRRLSNKLRYVKLPMVPRNKCQQHLDKKQKQRKAITQSQRFTENMFCAGFPEIPGQQQQDSCGGDGGGPFAIPNSDKWVLTGLVSWGFDCGRGYSYYTKVSNYIDWIGSYIGR